MKLIFILSLFLATNVYAHKSSEPIDISCGLTNAVSMLGPKVQFVTFAVSPTVLKEHFELENGMKTVGGFSTTLVPVEVKIKTSSGTVTKTGNLEVFLYEDGAIEVSQYNPMNGHMYSGKIFQEYLDDVTYNDSMQNQVESCKIFP